MGFSLNSILLSSGMAARLTFQQLLLNRSSSTISSPWPCSNILASLSPPSFLIHRRNKADDRKQLAKTTPKRDQGTAGERGEFDIDVLSRGIDSMFPDADTPNVLIEGVRYAELPICHVKTSKNNTHLKFTDHKGKDMKLYRTCGIEGFKNAKKGTNIAAQATAITISEMALKQGIVNVRVKVAGLGPGRMSSVKGLQMAGINIVSITDDTPISWNPPRPRKRRRV